MLRSFPIYLTITDMHTCILSHSVVSSSLHPMDYSLPGSSVHGIILERIPEWVAISFSRGSSQPHFTCQNLEAYVVTRGDKFWHESWSWVLKCRQKAESEVPRSDPWPCLSLTTDRVNRILLVELGSGTQKAEKESAKKRWDARLPMRRNTSRNLKEVLIFETLNL